ncbi:ATP-binding protein [Photobacterium atrarenae]|uniref:histidine kinase n=1 Tax=Photobacterium atrarenae TaxID=865757 RepID=A0ABY5GNI6_9GAMM|nr:ATP-binding protein [Photobacterium atrarenae]UTV30326.1 ATP-binding protein [Photobacterium atrarenae]
MGTMIRKLTGGVRSYIRLKAIIMIVVTTLIGSVTMVALTKLSMDNGLMRYVNSTEQQRTEQLIALLEQALPGYLEQRVSPHLWWPKLVNSTKGEVEAPQWQPTQISDFAKEFEPEFMHPPPDGMVRYERHPPPPSAGGPGLGEGRPPKHPRPRLGDVVHSDFELRVFLLDAEKKKIVGPLQHEDQILHPLHHQGEIIGYLGYIQPETLAEATEAQFVEEFNSSLIWIWAVSCGLTLAIAFPWAHSLLKTIEVFNNGVRQLALGTYETRVKIEREDELGQLASDINHLAAVLEQNERARQQWIADISHELRNPLAIMQAEVEAVQDGVRQNGESTMKSIHHNVTHLSHLVNDLYELSLSDIGALSYDKFSAPPVALMEQCVDLYRDAFDEKGLELTVRYIGERETMMALTMELDQIRIQQLFSNLLKNSLKYTDAGGKLEVVCQHQHSHLQIAFNDSAPGLSDDDLAQMFERLFRADPARQRNKSGGAGLGLSICRSIAEAHGMQLSAEHSELGGVSIQVGITLEQ